jgi:phage major head subunit gpT-like protein
MLVNSQSLSLIYQGFKTVVSDAFAATETDWPKIAMEVPSQSGSETYAWLGQFPSMREWVGPRVINNLSGYGFALQNKVFEATVSVARTDIEDDKIGIFKPVFSEMGGNAKRHPEELIFSLLKSGFATTTFDGQYFFDTDHPVTAADGSTATVANTDGGSGAPWFLLDVSRAIRPLIWQTRMPYEFVQMTASDDEHVFKNDEYVFGMRARANAGFGLWQLAWGSKQTLNAANYAAARAAMMGFKADGGKVLGIKPTVLVVPPSLEEAARNIVNSATGAAGATNPWANTAELIVSPYLV